MAIKELQARHAKPKLKQYKIADSGGLFLLVKPSGSKLWQMKYRFQGKEKLLSFGAFPSVGLAEVREKRLNAKHMIAQGKDPMTVKVESRRLPTTTFESIARIWHQNRESSLDPAHARRVLSRMERDVFPMLGKKEISKITPPDVLAMIRKIEARGALDISRRAKQGVGQVYQFAIASGWATNDPTTHLRSALKPRPRVEHMSKIPLAELPQFMKKLEIYDGENPRRRIVTKNAVKFALLTWVRTKELRFATKREFENLEGSDPLWRIPADRMKMKREHLIPLSTEAVMIAKEAMSSTEAEFVFPGNKSIKPLSENTMIYALYRMGYIGRQTVHGFRGLASTWANEQLIEIGDPPIWIRKFHEDWVELQLAHVEGNEVRGAYNAAEYLAPRRQMLQDWSDFIVQQKEFGLSSTSS